MTEQTEYCRNTLATLTTFVIVAAYAMGQIIEERKELKKNMVKRKGNKNQEGPNRRIQPWVGHQMKLI